MQSIPFIDYPVEDGMTHPSQPWVDEYVRRATPHLLEWLLYQRNAATLVRLAGRAAGIPFETKAVLVTRGLASPDLEIRDAALSAIETWGDKELAQRLVSYVDPIPWLQEYADKIRNALI